MKKSVLIIAAMIATVGLSAQGVSTKVSKIKTAQNSSVKLDKSREFLLNDNKGKELTTVSKKSLQLNLEAKKEAKLQSLNTGFTVKKETATGPSALYVRPDGYFYVGLSNDYYSLTSPVMVGAAYEAAMWYNASGENTESLEWTFTNPVTLEGTVTFTEKNPIVKYPYTQIKTPSLKATVAGKDSVYNWNGGILQTGGNSIFSENGKVYGLGNYDLELDGFSSGAYTQGGGKYLFGTGSADFWGDGDRTVGIGNYFEKPLHKYMFTSVWINSANFKADPTAKLELIIHRVDGQTGELKDTIATAVCYGNEVIAAGSSLFTIPFSFYEIDPETGRDEQIYVEIEDAIFMEFKGFTDGKVTSIDPLFQSDPHPTGESNAYVFLGNTSGAIGLYNVGDILNIGGAALNTSFLFNMDATYPYMFADENKKNAPNAGGTVNFEIESYYFPVKESQLWRIENALPDWITVSLDDAQVNTQTGIVTLPVKVAALPAGLDGRSAKIKVAAPASDVTLEVLQGNSVGVSTDVVESAIKAIRQGDNFVLSYPADVAAVAVYNVLGAKVAEYALSADGQFTLPAAGLANGAYVLKFAGASKSIKIVK